MNTTTTTSAPIDSRPAIDRAAHAAGWTLTNDTADTNVYQRNDGEHVHQVTVQFTTTGAVRAVGASIWDGGAQIGAASIDATGNERGQLTRAERHEYAINR